MIKAAVIGGTECLCDKLALTPMWEDYDILIINYMPINLLVKTASGFETEILKAIKHNKSVYITKQSTNHLIKLPKPLILLYNSHISTLISFGVKLINCTGNIFCDKNPKKLLTIADLEGFDGEILRIDSKTIVTPLALDFAKENNIKITRTDTI